MKFHPAVLMLLTWVSCAAIFLILPFRLEGRVVTVQGFLILTLFIGAFCGAAFMAARPQPQRPRPTNVHIDFRMADRLLMIAALIAIFASAMDIQGSNVLNLSEAYQARSDRAGALLAGGESASTIWFQLAFVTYPAGYVYMLREIAFRPRPVVWRVGVFGLLPVVLTSLAMGGRAPLLYAVLMMVLGYALRGQVFPELRRRKATPKPGRRRAFRLGPKSKLGLGVIGAVSAIYFVQVFFTRADVVGGVENMLGVAQLRWGVSFNGLLGNLFYDTFGSDGTYLIFIFSWYAIQGLIMANGIFSDYDGPMMMGGYGIDLVSAVFRRLDGDLVSNGFAVLLANNTYGFFPSAFGSLYVDLKFFGLIPCLIWGWLAGKVYGEIKRGQDPRWLMLGPFITLGVLFSLINTPLGFSNGLVTHGWLVLAFLASRTIVTAPRPPVARPA